MVILQIKFPAKFNTKNTYHRQIPYFAMRQINFPPKSFCYNKV